METRRFSKWYEICHAKMVGDGCCAFRGSNVLLSGCFVCMARGKGNGERSACALYFGAVKVPWSVVTRCTVPTVV